jgi:hypothetical protein
LQSLNWWIIQWYRCLDHVVVVVASIPLFNKNGGVRVCLVEEWSRMEWLNSYFLDVWFLTKKEQSDS